MATQTPLLAAVIFLLVSLTTPVTSVNMQPECTTFPAQALSDTLRTVIGQMQQTLLLVSKFVGLFDDLRLSTAIQDCVDLVDFSVDELNWSLTEMDKPGNGTAALRRRHDVKSWLSAAYSNQDTCLDSFDGTNGIVKELVKGSLVQVTELVGNVLGMVGKIPMGPTVSRDGRRLLEVASDVADPTDRYNRKTGRNIRNKLISKLYLKGDRFPVWLKGNARRFLQSPPASVPVDFTVAGDGSGNFTKIMDAISAAPDYSEGKIVIHVKKGVYNENVEIKKKKWNLVLIGDGMNVTIISGNRSFIDGWTTFRSATFAISGRGFIARDLTFENTAGPYKHQAVALRVDSDLSAFFRCNIKGYQDTLYAHSLRQFYRECRISGTVDFIFGNGAAVFQNCQIMARKPLPDQKNSVTAHGRKDPNQNTGFSIQYCNISGEPDLIPAINSSWTYLGRPWKEYSRTVIMQSYISNVIRPEGWLAWSGDFALNTLYYGEYMNFGPGSGLGNRVKWPGYHVINDSSLASNFTVAQFIDGNLWLPSTGVRFTAGLGV